MINSSRHSLVTPGASWEAATPCWVSGQLLLLTVPISGHDTGDSGEAKYTAVSQRNGSDKAGITYI